MYLTEYSYLTIPIFATISFILFIPSYYFTTVYIILKINTWIIKRKLIKSGGIPQKSYSREDLIQKWGDLLIRKLPLFITNHKDLSQSELIKEIKEKYWDMLNDEFKQMKIIPFYMKKLFNSSFKDMEEEISIYIEKSLSK